MDGWIDGQIGSNQFESSEDELIVSKGVEVLAAFMHVFEPMLIKGPT